MANKKSASPQPIGQDRWKYGHLHLIDNLGPGDDGLGPAISEYGNHVNVNRSSKHWIRSIQHVENILFSAGRHYIDDILVSRLSRDTNNDLSIVNEATRNIPRPVNDLLGRYIETNIALLTENRPRPRVTAKSNRAEDEDAANLSELVLEYLWEDLNMPELHREIARLLLHCGVCWMEVCWDPSIPRHMTVPQTKTEPTSLVQGPNGEQISIPVPHEVPDYDPKTGKLIMTDEVEYGDITAKVVTPFEMHVPTVHWWNGDDMGWIMREYYVAKDILQDNFSPGKNKMGLTKAEGWYLDRLDDVGVTNVKNLPLWWWERMSDLVEGPGPSLYVGTPEQWEGYTVVRWLDRKPNPKWPRGRSICIAGDKVIYDSPKEKGARAYSPRWPERWHPYIRFRWEAMIGSIYGRSLLSKLLPKIKRVNAIDTTLIMWRRTVPIANWIFPKGTSVVEDQITGRPGSIIEFDNRRTAGAKPEPVFAPEYPQTALKERETQIAEMESIAGTEEILRGQRPIGVNSAAGLDILRKQALASRSAILQAWDESLQAEGSAILQEVIKHIREDGRYAEGLRVLAREKASRLTIEKFSGMDISDNVVVRVDTASLALVSKEAKEAKAIEFMQYAPGLMQLPVGLRENILTELGFDKGLKPQGPDVERAKRLLSYIRQGEYEWVIPYPEDDPYVFFDMFVQELKAESYKDLNEEQQQWILKVIDIYKKQIEFREAQAMRMQQQMAGAGMAPQGGGQQGG
jgi:hypothetical protein